ncbi:MAG: protein kinase domain-containing protein [Thermoanaerobaculum sp.]
MKIGKYELLEPLGQGGFATVYRARDNLLARTVAIKVCQASDKEGMERFIREARLTGKLQHPNIAQVLDFGIEAGVPFIVQEFLSGWDLAQLLVRGPLALPLALSVLVQVARGLAYAHARQVLHRDIKPSNIRVLPTGLVKIMDFGIGRLMQDDSRLTRTGEALGTVGYFSPEMLLGQPLDQRADIFSFGVVAYEVLTGQHPFLSPDLGSTLYAIVHKQPASVLSLGGSCPPKFSEVVDRCLAKDPASRWGTTDELAQQLESLAHELNVEVGAVVPEEPSIPALRAREGVAFLATSRSLWKAYGIPFGLLLVGGALLALATAGFRRGTLPEMREPPPSAGAPVNPPPTRLPTPHAGSAQPMEDVVVEVVAVPPAVVVFGDQELGKVARQTLRLKPGNYEVTFSIPGYRTERKRVVVDSNTREIRLTMTPFGFLSVVPDLGTPLSGSKVFLDDRPLGQLPLVNAKVSEGSHQLSVTWPDGGFFRTVCQVEAERVTTVVVTKPY